MGQMPHDETVGTSMFQVEISMWATLQICRAATQYHRRQRCCVCRQDLCHRDFDTCQKSRSASSCIAIQKESPQLWTLLTIWVASDPSVSGRRSRNCDFCSATIWRRLYNCTICSAAIWRRSYNCSFCSAAFWHMSNLCDWILTESVAGDVFGWLWGTYDDCWVDVSSIVMPREG